MELRDWYTGVDKVHHQYNRRPSKKERKTHEAEVLTSKVISVQEDIGYESTSSSPNENIYQPIDPKKKHNIIELLELSSLLK